MGTGRAARLGWSILERQGMRASLWTGDEIYMSLLYMRDVYEWLMTR